MENHGTLKRFSEPRSSLQAEGPGDLMDSRMFGPETAQHIQRKLQSPLSSREVSLTLSVEDVAQRITNQLNMETDYTRNRITKIVKQVLKKCGYVVLAAAAVPLITGT